MRQLGNAVPVSLSEVVAKTVSESLTRHLVGAEINCRETGDGFPDPHFFKWHRESPLVTLSKTLSHSGGEGRVIRVCGYLLSINIAEKVLTI
jgi:hypothetical protein